MGSSEDTLNKGIDATVGGLVWVRRRNGSWWPGRILGPEELPESCLVSPRSGTPVKLLGREDASVDWYNLERSKRVKAFRCGEYDECIEKAKASASISKKTVKYARREDAILHALELESARLGKDHPNFFSRAEMPKDEERSYEESPPSSAPVEETETSDEELSNSEDNTDSAHEWSQSGVSFEEPDHHNPSNEQSVQGRRRRTPNDSEDDGCEGIKRMRGLEDLGDGVVSSLKRKRSQVAHVHEFLKRKKRRRALTKVLKSTAMVSVPIMCEELASPTGSHLPISSDSKVLGVESNDSKRSLSVKECEISSAVGPPTTSSSDGLYDVPFVMEEIHSAGLSSIVSCASQKAHVGAGAAAHSSQSSQVETLSLGNEEYNESGSTSSGTADLQSISQSMETGTSKWQLKGKRNSRHTNKIRKQDLRKLEGEADVYLAGEDPDVFPLSSDKKVNYRSVDENGVYSLKSKQATEIHVDEYRGWNRNYSQKQPHVRGSTAETAVPQRLLPLRQSRFTVNPKYDSSDFSLRHHIGSSLYDVHVEVKACSRPQHVPYISLMSKLSGQPIIGHPVTVEALDDGFCDALISLPECYSSSSEYGENLGENASTLETTDIVYKRRPTPAGRIPRKHSNLQPHVPPTKSPKSRRNGLLSKKIRKLSSLTGSRKQVADKKPVIEKFKGPAVACVPLKVVFSRINAALSGSMRPSLRLNTADSA